MMVVLALDTTTRAGSIALAGERGIVCERVGDPGRTHGERLPGDLLAVLTDVGMTLADVDLYGVCSGPGSFTGLRVGLAAIQGLAMGTSRQVVPIPTLDALAYGGLWAAPKAEQQAYRSVVAWMDAQRGQVFAQAYTVREGGALDPCGEPLVDSPAAAASAVAERLPAGAAIVVNDTSPGGETLLNALVGVRATVVTERPSLATVVARLAQQQSARQAVPPHAIRPIYVRRSDAEIARERVQS